MDSQGEDNIEPDKNWNIEKYPASDIHILLFQGGVTVEELVKGTGQEAKKGNFVGMYYSGFHISCGTFSYSLK